MKKKFKIFIIALVLLFLIVLLGTLISNYITHRTNASLVTSGIERKYQIYVPKSSDPDKSVPLILSFHGLSGWATQHEKTSNWNALADQHGFIVAYPLGTGNPLGWKTNNKAVDESIIQAEVTFISDLIDKISADYNIDQNRIYVNGFSNGGGMSFLLACRLSERITAMGGVSGAYLTSWDYCQPTHPMPVIAFHGTEDEVVTYAGGPSNSFDIPFPNIPQWAEQWAVRNECDLNPSETLINPQNTLTAYQNCRSGAQVLLYSILGGGHAWPNGIPITKLFPGPVEPGLDATEIMWEIFSQFSLDDL